MRNNIDSYDSPDLLTFFRKFTTEYPTGKCRGDIREISARCLHVIHSTNFDSTDMSLLNHSVLNARYKVIQLCELFETQTRNPRTKVAGKDIKKFINNLNQLAVTYNKLTHTNH